MTDPNQNELLDLYRLHAELADRVSQRREGANRLFVSLLTGLLVFLAALLRFAARDASIENVVARRLMPSGNLSPEMLAVFIGILGVVLSVAWFIVIRSYRQLNTGKFKALQELESKLAYPFFRREWEILGEGKDFRRYWRLTVVETLLPLIFALAFAGILVCALFGSR